MGETACHWSLCPASHGDMPIKSPSCAFHIHLAFSCLLERGVQTWLVGWGTACDPKFSNRMRREWCRWSVMVLVVLSFCSEPDSFLPLFSSWGSQASMPVFWCETSSLPLSKKAVRLQSLKCCHFPCTCCHRVGHNLRPKAGWGYSMRGHSCLLQQRTCWTRAVFLLAAWPFKQPQHVHSLQGSPQPHWSLL